MRSITAILDLYQWFPKTGESQEHSCKLLCQLSGQLSGTLSCELLCIIMHIMVVIIV